jgi:transposase InsO family protein
MDFVSDSLFDGRRFRAFTLVENFSRECLAIRPAPKIFGSDVAEVLDEVVETHGKPNRIFLDNGPEFISKALDLWAYQAGVTLDFSRPGKPTDNAYIESFNGSFRDECLNANWFLFMEDTGPRSKLGLRITMSSDRTARSGKRLPSSSWGLGTGSPESRLRPETNVSNGSGS